MSRNESQANTRTDVRSLSPDQPIEVRVEAPAKPGLSAANTQRIHDAELGHMEDHSPEGREAHNSLAAAWLALIGPPILILGVIVVLWFAAGPRGAALAAVFMSVLYLVAGYPVWNAARLRLIERLEMERRISRKIQRIEKRVAKFTV
ncbi:hypothetical protein BH11PLA1_BH11PLA1_21700 [soil metagenome]